MLLHCILNFRFLYPFFFFFLFETLNKLCIFKRSLCLLFPLLDIDQIVIYLHFVSFQVKLRGEKLEKLININYR